MVVDPIPHDGCTPDIFALKSVDEAVTFLLGRSRPVAGTEGAETTGLTEVERGTEGGQQRVKRVSVAQDL